MPKKVDECVRSVLEDNPDYSESRAYAICNAQFKFDVDIIDSATVDELGIEAEDMDEMESFEEKIDGLWVDEQDEGAFAVLDPEGYTSKKGVYEGVTLGTDGDPGDDAAFTSFMDALVDAGGDAWTVRNGELFTWSEDASDFPRHDPVIKVVGLSIEEVEAQLARFNVEFMSVEEGAW